MNTLQFRELERRFPFLAFDLDTSIPRIRCPKDGAGTEVFLQGAHLTRFDSAKGDSPLFLSREAVFEEGTPIRGGVPVIFPWFGPRAGHSESPPHGLVRTTEWELFKADEHGLTLATSSTPATLEAWPSPYRLTYEVSWATGPLRLSLTLENTGTSSFTFEIALHTYLRISDIKSVRIEGLDGKTYLDKVDGAARKVQQGNIEFEGETDRVYLDSGGPILLRDGERKVRLESVSGWHSTIVWNPWINKSRSLPDLGDDEWKQFLCIESGAVADNAQTLPAGQKYELAIEIGVETKAGE